MKNNLLNKMLKNLTENQRVHFISAIFLSVLVYSTIQMNIIEIKRLLTSTIHYIFYYLFTVFVFVSAFLLFYLKKWGKIKWFLFSLMAFVFVIAFMTEYYLKRGYLGFIESDIIENGTPTCHIALINNLLSLPIIQTFVYPGKLTGNEKSIYGMFLIWLWATILIGKGFCSWGCFFGGWDNFFSKTLKKPLITIKEENYKILRIFPYVFIFLIAFFSLLTISPVFCAYICPFKTITEFQHITDFISWLSFIVPVSLFVVTTIVLPIIFGKRIWCSFLCPFGAFQGIIGKISIFRLKIDKDKCINCKKCINSCISYGITDQSLKKYRSTLSCSYCGLCIDNCPKDAISISIAGNKESLFSGINNFVEKIKNIYLNKILLFITKILNDIFNPVTILIFFGFNVYITFFSGFYFQALFQLYKIFTGN